MSRIANAPITVPKGVNVNIDGSQVHIKGPKGDLSLQLHETVTAKQDGDEIVFQAANDVSRKYAGTMRALTANMVEGVTDGFERRLQLVGVGYRAQMQGNSLNLTLGHSHPVDFTPPEGISIEVPSQTEVVVKGASKQQVGAVAAKIRSFRPPEPYKGKGVRYADERISLKEAKKA